MAADTQPDEIGAPLAAARAALEQAARQSSWQSSDVELAAGVGGWLALARLAEGQAVRMLGEASARGLAATSGAGTLPAWVRQVSPTTSRTDAARAARVAERLHRSPLQPVLASTREAVEAGRPGGGHAGGGPGAPAARGP